MNFSELLWQPDVLRTQCAGPVLAVLNHAGLLDNSASFPSAHQLNQVARASREVWHGPEFKAQGEYPESESRYYEAIIAEDSQVPTREHSWHDLFNALVWIQFPRTKALLNRLHMEDINLKGAHPRTPRRNRITHFDECGVVIAVEEDHLQKGNVLLSQLAHHQWNQVFLEERSAWGEILHPFVFGHANFEIMLSPFEGLTGKWMAIKVPRGFSNESVERQHERLDVALCERIQALDNFNRAPLLKPIPLLGIPHWYQEQTPCFYENKDYFRPMSVTSKPSVQLPLT